MAAAAPAVELPAQRDSVATKILRATAKTPLHILLVVLGGLWLVPTVGLFLTSILPAETLASKGWWQIFSKPSLATWSNYDALFHNSGLTTALKTTAYIAVGNTVAVVVIGAMAGYAFAWLDFPGRDWAFVGVIGLLVVPLQMALIPTFGLLITSLLPAGTLASKGWWVIFSHPSLATWSNYDALFHNSGLLDALKTTAYIAIGNTLIIVVIGALAGYALAWLDFPGRDWLFIVIVGLLVVPLQMAL
ncbi:MAG TPA: hypothetical protein VFA30_05840, partial [Gaiellaceae bacterium]|nr:hypothetical protein [Gaiellaceae bacterium]